MNSMSFDYGKLFYFPLLQVVHLSSIHHSKKFLDPRVLTGFSISQCFRLYSDQIYFLTEFSGSKQDSLKLNTQLKSFVPNAKASYHY